MNARADYHDFLYLQVKGCPGYINCRSCKYSNMCFLVFPPILRWRDYDIEPVTIYTEGE